MYYGGIDLGTSSVGWALTDEQYRLIHKKGKDLWGVRLFDEAEPAKERRSSRVSRRRRARETARIGMLREYFSAEIEQTDPGFYQRLEESKYHREDKRTKEKYAIFADGDFTDREYYETYPTIFHLRKELLESTEWHDVRLVYLAVLNLFKRRGHFLNEYLGETDKEGGMDELYRTFCDSLPEELELKFPELCAAAADFEQILGNRDLSRSGKAEELLAFLGMTKKENKKEFELVKMFCGLSGKLAVIFGKHSLGSEFEKKELSFRSSAYEETMTEIGDILPQEYLDVIEAAKNIHDKGLLGDILKGETYLSIARVASYKKHKADLTLLKKTLKKYCKREEYDAYFRVMADDNYSGYVGSVNSEKERSGKDGLQRGKFRRNRNAKKENYKNFWKKTKELLNQMPEEDEDVRYLKQELEKETLLPKQLTSVNGVIPNQVHLSELKKILSNAEGYLPFLLEKDESGLTVSERIVRLFQFQIPYYVGPLYIREGEEGRKWVKRKEGGKVLPWNMEEKVDLAKTREAFITGMVRRCTYMEGQYVLPKNALLYEAFMALNELNNVRIHGEKLPVALKQQIYRELFMTGKRITRKRFWEYLVADGQLSKEDTDAISGIDGDFKQSLVSYGRFYSVFGEELKNRDIWDMAEQIIFWGTVYSNDKKLMKELITETFGEKAQKTLLSEAQMKRISGYKWKDWGRLSAAFLTLRGCSKDPNEGGVIYSLIEALWETDCNLMELLSDRFTFMDNLEERTKKNEKLLGEFSYQDLEDSYLSAPVKRMTWQTILILKELYGVMGEPPKKLFLEMPREHGEKGKRTVSRKKKLEALYKGCKEDGRNWEQEIKGLTEDQLRSRKLYLYYTQMGKCMYTGRPIDLETLLRENSRYDIDHIYPRHFIKDDSIENNLVLVEKESNGHKKDHYPIEASIRQERSRHWKFLKEKGLITEEKYKRLTRSWEFTEEELAAFINRQIVETGQAAKYTAQLLKRLLPETEIVYVKAGNVSDFRNKRDLLKSRVVNDFHHAHDAYLNIVVGNTYDTKFTKSPIHYIRNYKRDPEKYRYHMDRMFDFDVIRDGVTAWKAGKDGTIVTVNKMMKKNTPLLTKRAYEAHGGIAEQTIYSAKEAKAESYIPVKSGDERLGDVTKYGGFSSVAGAYYFLAEHGKEGKRKRTLEQMPIYLKERLEQDEEALKEYCIKKLGLVNPDIRIKKIPFRSFVKRNGYYMYLGGKTNAQIWIENGVSLCLSRQWVNYIKRMENFNSNEKEEDNRADKKKEITKQRNEELYQELLTKHRDTIYAKKPNPVYPKLSAKQNDFKELTLREQVRVLLELLKATQCVNLGVKAAEIDLKVSPLNIGKGIGNEEEFLLIYQSVTGIYTRTIDLKTV